MAEVKVSALTALTGANVANGDELLITDVGTPNVSKKITADELAQATQFSSRYKPLASDTLWLPAGSFGGQFGSPALTATASNWSAWLLDASSVEVIGCHFIAPPGWSTVHFDLFWSNHSTGSGDVRWGINYGTARVDGDTLTASQTGAEVTSTAGAQNVLKVVRMVSNIAVIAGGISLCSIYRSASDAADTLANDAALLGVRITRAS